MSKLNKRNSFIIFGCIKFMKKQDKLLAQNIYLILGSLFITSLVVSNLIFQKFFYWHPFEINIFGEKLFELSVGILHYPITFLITDLISEIYGKKKANSIVTVGIFASIFSILIIYVANSVPAINGSPVNDELFNTVFGSTVIAVFASMMSYLFAQYIDIRLFHFWKRLTKVKHLWLRNNGSTVASQFVDTTLVICILFVGVWETDQIFSAIIDGWLFKMMMALIDTPIIYGIIYFWFIVIFFYWASTVWFG